MAIRSLLARRMVGVVGWVKKWLGSSLVVVEWRLGFQDEQRIIESVRIDRIESGRGGSQSARRFFPSALATDLV